MCMASARNETFPQWESNQLDQCPPFITLYEVLEQHMDTTVLAYILLGATMVVPGLIILVIVSYTNARRQVRPRRRSVVRRAIPRAL
jgi:hypothetical protein